MSARRNRPLAVAALGLVAILASGCTGYVGDGGYDLGANYYGPSDGYYGAWDQGYAVGPFFYGNHRPFFGDRRFGHPWRGPEGAHFIPSIPGGRRGPGFHGGDFHGGGFHGGDFHGGGGHGGGFHGGGDHGGGGHGR